MKFYCEVCNTKYSIADDKVRGKVLKVRCKKCSNIITVREALAPIGDASEPASTSSAKPSPPPSPPPKKDKPPAQNWYYSINGESAGPFDLSQLRDRFTSGELGDECYVWHETLVDWKPVAQVDAFSAALQQSQEVKPRSKTLGFTGKVEAINATDGPNKERGGAVPSSFQQNRQAPTPERSARPSSRNDKIDKLREKLKKGKEVEAPQKDDWTQNPNTAQMTFAPGVEAAPPDGEPDVPRSESAIPAFDLPPAGGEREDSTSSTSDILADDDERRPLPMGLGEEEPASETPEDSGVIPFFPEAPRLESAGAPATSRSQSTSGSLLIQLQEIQKEGRGKAVWLAVVVALVLGGIAATAITVGIMNATEKTPLVENQPRKNEPRELKERVYSSSKLDKFAEMKLEDEVIKADEKVEDLEPLAETPDVVPMAQKSKPDKAPPAKTDTTKGAAKAVVQPSAKAEPARIEKARPPEAEEKSSKPMTAKERLLAYSKGSKTRIERPEDKLASGGALPNTLQKDDARKGFRRIRRSVMVCRERFMRRGGRFETPKIKVTIVVQPSGKVSKFSTSPGSLVGTEFDRCMNSHMSRWRFARWDGSPTEVSSSYILQ